MKHTRKMIALSLSLAVASLAVLTACSGGGTSSTAQTSSSGSASASASDSASGQDARETVMGEVTYVGSNYISVTAYTGGEDITDFTDLDVAGLTATDETKSIDTSDSTEYLKVESGMLNTAAREDVATGSFIVAAYDEDGSQQIILIDRAAESDSTSDASGSAAEEEAGDSSSAALESGSGASSEAATAESAQEE